MKQNKLYAVLAAAGVLCLAAQLGDAALPEIFTAVSAFPFEQIGSACGALSLSGSLGNAGGTCAVWDVCLLPHAHCCSYGAGGAFFRRMRSCPC